MPIIQNKKNGKAVIKVVNGSETITLSQLAVDGENVRSSAITAVYWTGPCTVTRNSVLILNLTDGQDNWILDGDFTIREQANSSYDLVANGTLIIEVNKITEVEV